VESSPGSSRKSLVTFLTFLDSRRLFVLLITLLLLFVTFSSYYFTNRLFLKKGDIATSDYYSKITTRYENKIKTEELRKKEEAKVPISYKIDPLILNVVLDDMTNFKNLLALSRNNKVKSNSEKITEISKLLALTPDQQNIAKFLANSDEKTINLVFDITKKVLTIVMQRGVREVDVTEYSSLAKTIDEKIKELDSRTNIDQIVALLIRKKIRFNMSIDEEANRLAIALAREKIVPIMEDIFQNQKIISKGQVITAEDLDKLKTLELLSTTQNWIQWTKAGFYSLILIIFLLYFLWITNKTHYIVKFNYFLLLNFILFLSVLSTRILAPISQYLVPMLMIGTLLVVFFDATLAYIVSSFTFLLLFLAFGFDISLLVSYLVTMLTSIYLLNHFKKYSDFIKNGFTTSLIFLFFTFILTSLSYENFLHTDKLLLLGFILINAIGSNLIALGITVILENTWNFITPLRLFELTDPNSPLLRKMFEVAPGTYQHSIMIANISSHAGEAIGLDPLLIRVGSYYHDIGKIPSSFSFTENSSGSNILDTLSPIEAAEKIKSHLTEGLLIADKYKLPQPIKDFVLEHHGTSRISFLYDSAKTADPSLTDDSAFRYPGPKPQSKEISIVMLADSVEAAVRSMENRTFEKINQTVRSVISSKVKDNQLSESNLSFQELEKVTESFIFTLDSLYHSRVAYTLTQPKEEEKQ